MAPMQPPTQHGISLLSHLGCDKACQNIAVLIGGLILKDAPRIKHSWLHSVQGKYQWPSYREGNWEPEDAGNLPEAAQEAGRYASPLPQTLPGTDAGCCCYAVLLARVTTIQRLKHPHPQDPTSNSHQRDPAYLEKSHGESWPHSKRVHTSLLANSALQMLAGKDPRPTPFQASHSALLLVFFDLNFHNLSLLSVVLNERVIQKSFSLGFEGNVWLFF